MPDFYILKKLKNFKKIKKKKKKKLKKEKKKNLKIFGFFPIFSSDKSPASGKENVRFLVSPDFENLPDFWTGQ